MEPQKRIVDKHAGIVGYNAKIIKAAGVRFAMLGPEELSSGDAARRLGNEYLFQMLAQPNVEMLNLMANSYKSLGAADRASIAAAGVDPMAQKIVVVKLGYLFPDLYDHAPRAIMALSPGATDLPLERLPYRRLARPVSPLDGDLAWEP